MATPLPATERNESRLLSLSAILIRDDELMMPALYRTDGSFHQIDSQVRLNLFPSNKMNAQRGKFKKL